jgi:hypothetical protein
LLLDEHVPPAFGSVLEAFGHAVGYAAAEVGGEQMPDDDLIRHARRNGYDALLSLDQNRQQAVWMRVYEALALGQGRLVRVKLRRTVAPDPANLARAWLRPNDLEPALEDRSRVLIQLGLAIASGRQLRGGMRTFTQAQVASLLQAEFRD